MKKSLFLISIISLMSLSSCHLGTSGTWKNDRIDKNIRNQVNSLNKKLLTSLLSKNVTAVKQLMAPVLIENSSIKIDSLTNSLGAILNNSDYSTIDEYYTKNTTTKIPNTLISANGSNKDYIINYLALNNEMYVSVLKLPGTAASNLMITIYGKYDDEWKINILQIGQYELAGKTAPDFYDSAVKFYNKGSLVDAADMLIMASQLANPGGLYFKYKNNDAMKDFYSKVINETNTKYKFPFDIKQVKTTPQIFGINPQFIGQTGREGIYPMIKYKSQIKLEDTIALKAENLALQKIIGNIFSGIDKDNNHIIYEAFDEIPNGMKAVNHFGFIQKLN